MKKNSFLFLFILIFLYPFFTFAQEKSWYFKSWDVDIQINKDATFIVREKQTFDFTGNFHWVKRDIAKKRLEKIVDVAVFDEKGSQLEYPDVEVIEDTEQVSIKLNFDLTDTQKTWTFQYKVIGGIGYFEDHDELYWNAVSSERDVEINNVRVLVHLPELVATTKLKQKLFIGPTGSILEAKTYSVLDGKKLEFTGTNIAPYENFTIVAGWPRGIVYNPGTFKINSKPKGADIYIDGKNTGIETPAILQGGKDLSFGKHNISLGLLSYKRTPFQEINVVEGKTENLNFVLERAFYYQVLRNLLIFLPLIVFIGLFIRWFYKGRDPKFKGTIIAQYEPPDNITPAEMGVLIDERVDLEDITSTLVDLAYKGYLKIKEVKEKRIIGEETKYTLIRTNDFRASSALKEHERLILEGIFNGRTEVGLDSLVNRFYRHLSGIRKALYNQTVEADYFKKSPEFVRMKNRIGGVLLASGGGVLAFVWPLAGIPILISGLLILVFAGAMPAKTQKGSDAYWHALGFREYLHTAERFRLDTCTPETFEKFLAYAMVFGVEKQWANRFVDIYKEPPSWYESIPPITAFSVADFTNSVSFMSVSVSNSFSSSPSSSSGFGDGGGGGSAGGGGGGGGSSAG